jgi:hypothetical protein
MQGKKLQILNLSNTPILQYSNTPLIQKLEGMKNSFERVEVTLCNSIIQWYLLVAQGQKPVNGQKTRVTGLSPVTILSVR